MSDERIKADWRCPECGRDNPLTAALCSWCLAPRPGSTGVAATPGPDRGLSAPLPDEDYPPSLGTWEFRRRLPGITLIVLAGLCVVLVPVWGLGLVLLLVLAPAMLHVRRVSREREAHTEQPQPNATSSLSCGLILAGAGLGLLVFASSVIAFVAVCVPTGAYAMWGQGYWNPVAFSPVIWWTGALAGLLAACAVGYGLARLFFRRNTLTTADFVRPRRPNKSSSHSFFRRETRE